MLPIQSLTYAVGLFGSCEVNWNHAMNSNKLSFGDVFTTVYEPQKKIFCKQLQELFGNTL